MFAFRANYRDYTVPYIYITATESTNVTVKAPFVQYNSSYVVEGYKELILNTPLGMTETIANKGIEITAEKPISVYAYNRLTGSVDVTVVLPENVLGTKYILDTALSTAYYEQQFLVTVLSDNTTVTIDDASGNQTILYLDKFDVYMGQNASGTIITASNPVSVEVGHKCANIPESQSYCDILSTSVPPYLNTVAADYYFIVPQMRPRTVYSLSIVAAFDDTLVKIFDSERVLLETVTLGQQQSIFRSFNLTAVTVTATRNVLVNQYGHGSDRTFGDPSQTVVPAVRHFTTKYSFYVPMEFTNTSTVCIVVNGNTDLNGFWLDDSALPYIDIAEINLPGGFIYKTIYMNVTAGHRVLLHVDHVKFGAYWYARTINSEVATFLGYEL